MRGALILFAILFLGVSDTQLIPPLLPLIADDLGISAGRAGLIVTVYALAAASFALLLGAVSDRLGRVRILTLALAAFGIASLATSQSSHFTTLLAARFLTGLSAGTLSTMALSYAADLYSYEKRGRAMGILSMAYFLAFVIGIPLGSFIADRVGWRWVFVGVAVSTVGVLVLAIRLLPSDPPRRDRRASGSSLAHFGKADRLAGIVAAFLTSGGLVGFITYVGVWLASADVPVVRIGLLLMAAGVAATVASPASGWLSDRIGKKPLIVSANVVLAPLFVITSRLAWGPGLFVAVTGLAVLASARQAPLHALTTELVELEERGSYVAIRNAASQLGIAVIVTTSAVAFDRSGFTATAWVSAGATILLAGVCLAIREPGRREPGRGVGES